jgi:hypothetical protein
MKSEATMAKCIDVGTALHLPTKASDLDVGDTLDVDVSTGDRRVQIHILHVERNACTFELQDGSRWRVTPWVDGDSKLVNGGSSGTDWVVRFKLKSTSCQADRQIRERSRCTL